MERNIDKEQDPGEWSAVNMRLLKAGLRSGDQTTLDSVRDRLKAKYGTEIGEKVYDNLELVCIEEIMDERLKEQIPNMQSPE